MASSSGSGGGDKNPIKGGSDKNPIAGRPIDHGFYEALWELIYQALGINIQQTRTPDQGAGFLKKPSPEKPPLHPKTLQLVLEAITAKARSPARRRKKRLREYGTVVHNVPAKKKARKEKGKQEKVRLRPEVYAVTMRRVLLHEVHGYFDVLQGVDDPPQDPARRNLREYLEFLIQQVDLDVEMGPVRGPPPSAPPVARCYFRVAARAARPDQLDPPPEVQEYLQELVTREVRNLFHAQEELDAMYSDDSDYAYDSEDAHDSDDPGDGGDGAGSSMGVQV